MVKFAIKKVSKPIKRLRTYKSSTLKKIQVEEVKVVDEVLEPKVEVIEKTTKVEEKKEVVLEKPVESTKKENKNKKTNDMETKDKIAYASAILANEPVDKVKKIKKEKGLIERTESSKIILTEDNKELLND